jgi:hypothetical protein
VLFNPARAAPRAPYWLSPTPWPKPPPVKLNDVSAAATVGDTAASRATASAVPERESARAAATQARRTVRFSTRQG